MTKTGNVVFEIRQMLDCSWEAVGKEAASMGYSAVAKLPDADLALKEMVEASCAMIAEDLRNGDFSFVITEASAKQDCIRLRGPVREVRSVLAIIRRAFAIDAYDHRRHVHLEIEQIGPGEGERKIFGTKGPAKSESGAAPTERKPEFGTDGVDADTYAPFVLTDLRKKKEQPEVHLEFSDFDMLSDTLELEDSLEMDGDTLGDIMMAVFDKQNLVQDRQGTHEGGYFDNFEGSTVLFHFNSLADAVRVAEHFCKIFTDKKLLRNLLKSHGISLS